MELVIYGGNIDEGLLKREYLLNVFNIPSVMSTAVTATVHWSVYSCARGMLQQKLSLTVYLVNSTITSQSSWCTELHSSF